MSAERVESNGVYLMDDSETLTIFIGHRCSDQLIQQLFGYVNVNSMPELVVSNTKYFNKTFWKQFLEITFFFFLLCGEKY